MEVVRVRNVVIGEGMPKICAPVMGASVQEILDSARLVAASGADIAEWRADWYETAALKDILCMLEKLRGILGEMPLLFTFRTLEEGGHKPIERAGYIELTAGAAMSGMADLADVELFTAGEKTEHVIEAAHTAKTAVILSSHDFQKTPGTAEMISRLQKMEALGADISKIAVMPKTNQDVLALLSATAEFSAYAKRPVITMSMGRLGALSRISGEVFGSAVTFGSAGQASAPGQLEISALKRMLLTLHENR